MGAADGIGALCKVASLGISIYELVEKEKAAKEQAQFRANLTAAIQEISLELSQLSTELGDVISELEKVDKDLRTLEQAQLLTLLARLEGPWHDVASLVPPGQNDPTPDGWRDLADAIMGLRGTPSVNDTMLTIQDLLTRQILPDASTIEISGTAFRWIFAQLVRGLHLLAFGCAYTRAPRDFGYYQRLWFQNLQNAFEFEIGGSKGWYQRSWAFAPACCPNGTFIPTLALDSIYLHSLLQPAIDPIWLCTDDAFGNLRIQGRLEIEGNKPSGMKFTAKQTKQAALMVKTGSVEAMPWPTSPTKNIWYFDFRQTARYSNFQSEICPVYLTDGALTKDELDYWADALGTHIAFTYDVDGQAAIDSPRSLGSYCGQLNIVEVNQEFVFCISDRDQEDPNLPVEDTLLTWQPGDTKTSLTKLGELTSLTSAQWRVRYSGSNYSIRPLASSESDPVNLGISDTGDWEVFEQIPVRVSISRPHESFSDCTEEMFDPRDMLPPFLHLSNGSGKTRHAVFIAAPFVPSRGTV